MTFLSILTTIVGSAMALSGLPQAIKIFKRKSAKDISAITYGTLAIGALVWIFYGIEIKSMPVLISNGIGFFVACIILVGWLKYGK
jgi:MtN3 and saliva related transmembrane protein